MRIKSIKIENFKSIGTQQTVEFGENGLVTLIGKNGSGKTNLLEALNTVFEVNSREYYRGYTNFKYSVVLELDDETLKELCEETDYSPDDRFIEVYNEGGGNDTDGIKVRFMHSRLYAAALKDTASAIKAQASALSEKLKALINDINGIRVSDKTCGNGFFYELKDVKNSQTCELKSEHYYRTDDLVEEVEEIVNSICRDEEEMDLYGYDESFYRWQRIIKYEEPKFRLVYREPYMTEFDKRFIVSVKREEIQRFIDEFNARIDERSSEIKSAVKSLNNTISKFNRLIKKAHERDDEDYVKNEAEEKKKQGFLEKLTAEIGRKSRLVPSTEQMFGDGDGYRTSGYDYDGVITETYLKLSYDGEERDKILKAYYKNRNITKVLEKLGIDEKELAKDFEKALNEDLPQFDRGMIEKIAVEYERGLKLFVVEKNGDKTPFAKTSLGRKWFFTYYFIKNSLKPGEVLILDEPGAFLHPEAQSELLRDLENLAKTNTVILCTHSPYMISAKSNEIHVVLMGDSGTAVKHINFKSLERLRGDAGFASFNSVALNSIILNVPTNQIICEGERDVCCLEAFMDYFGVDRKNFTFLQLMGCDHAPPLIEFYVNNNLDLRVLLDKDVEEKIVNRKIKVPKSISETESAKISEIGGEYLTLVFAGGEGRNDIEGLFSEEDSEVFLEYVTSKHSEKVKKNIKEILLEKGCDKQTEENFRNLFKQLLIPVQGA